MDDDSLRGELHMLRLENARLRERFRETLKEEFGREMAAMAATLQGLLAAASEPIQPGLPGGTFADDLLTLAGIVEETKFADIADRLRDKADDIRAAVNKAKGAGGA